ncbi:SPOR domain-containing protein [Sagittula sp. SSi028]|uniref:SPOR domain-containing protein n=1 Tax=Sagittula sp. SSi028 TaxID=3400636 RepID=UPI003AF86DAA
MADYTYDGGYQAPVSSSVGKTASLTNMAGAVASLALVVGVGVWGYGVMSRDVSGVPVVQAMAGPMRVAPENPGGTLADHQGLAVNAVAGLGAAEGPADQLLLAPVPAGLAAEDVAANAMVPIDEPAQQPVEVSLTNGATEADPLAEDNPILALAAQIAADNEPLSDLPEHTPAADSPFANAQDVSSAGADALVEEITDTPEITADLGPGLPRSLRPKTRPSGLQLASVGQVDATVVAAASSATREIDPSSLPAGTRLVQIGAFDSAETARSEWTRLETRFGDFLDGKGRVIQQAQSGGRTFYRLRAEGFVDLADARRFCAAFVAEKVDCIPVVTR